MNPKITAAPRNAMTGYVALLRAVNVGGTGKLSMTTLQEVCQECGFGQVRTYIASGNVVFQSDRSEDEVRLSLEDELKPYFPAPTGIFVRTAEELADILKRNPFADQPANRVMTLFVDKPLPADPLDGVKGMTSEQIRLGKRELFIHYPDGMAKTRLRLPLDQFGTARNMNTVAKLAEMSRSPGS